MKNILIFILTIGMMTAGIFGSISPAYAAGWTAKDVQSAIGNHRVSSGVDVQIEDAGMSQAAQAWAEKLALSDAPASQDPSKAGSRSGSQLVGSHSVGDVNAVITSWKNGANSILVNPSYGLIGTGVATSASGKVYVVANFAPVVAPAPVPVKVPAVVVPAPVVIPEPEPESVSEPVVVEPEPETAPVPEPVASPSSSKPPVPVSEPKSTPTAVPSVTPTPEATEASTPAPEASPEVLKTSNNETDTGKEDVRRGLGILAIMAGLFALASGLSLLLIREHPQVEVESEEDHAEPATSTYDIDDDDPYQQAITRRRVLQNPDTSLGLPNLPKKQRDETADIPTKTSA